MSLSRFELSLHSHVHGGRSGPLLQGAITNLTRRNPPPKASKVCFSLYEAFSLSGVLSPEGGGLPSQPPNAGWSDAL